MYLHYSDILILFCFITQLLWIKLQFFLNNFFLICTLNSLISMREGDVRNRIKNYNIIIFVINLKQSNSVDCIGQHLDISLSLPTIVKNSVLYLSEITSSHHHQSFCYAYYKCKKIYRGGRNLKEPGLDSLKEFFVRE